MTLKLHIGGKEPKDGWSILNIQPAPHVDYVGSCTDLSAFADNSVNEIYASHVFEHLGFREELTTALAECCRVLKPGCLLGISVPDISVLGTMMADPSVSPQDQHMLLSMIFGSQTDPYDFHKVGFTENILKSFLAGAGFDVAKRVESLGLFQDASEAVFLGRRISLNMVAKK